MDRSSTPAHLMPPRFRRRIQYLTALACVLAAAALFVTTPRDAYAQGRPRVEIRTGFAMKNGAEDRGWTFCRMVYTSGRREAMGSGWTTDYPDADYNLMIRMSQLTHTRVAWWSAATPGHTTVRLSDTGLYHCPFLYTSDVGTIQLDGIEIENLRNYLLKGGFLWVDDFWGSVAWDQFAREITRVLPEFKIADIEPEHPLLNYIYHIKKLPQIPSIQFWRRAGGATSERGADSDTPHLRGIFDGSGRLMVVITHNTDIADGWEREAEDDAYFFRFSWDAYAVAVNIVMWSLTH